MSKKIISAFLALTMLFMTACGDSSQADTSKADTTTTAVTEQDNSEADSSSDSEETTTTTAKTTTTTSDTSEKEEKSSDTTTTSATTTKAQATTTTKQAVATTKATQKPVQTTKATVKVTAKATTKATVKTTPKATQPAVNTAAYVNNTITDINKMFPESQFNKALYDKFERLCKGVPTNDDLYQIKEQLCNFAMRKYSGKTGTITYWHGITPTPWQDTVTAKKPISITIDRTLEENDAHQNNGADTVLVYCNTWTADRNYKNICTFIKDCYSMVSSGVPSLVKRFDNKRPEKTYNHKFYVFIGLGGYDNNLHHNLYYLWFCER